MWKSIIAGAALAVANCHAQTSVQLKVVKNSPFSAQAVTESTQTLADGNRIVHQSTAFIARDSDGRTRREQSLSAGNGPVVFIQDPVTGAAYVLDPQSHFARKIVMPMRETDRPPGAVKGLAAMVGTAGPNGGNIKSDDLGIQFIQGFMLQGSRLTRSLPASQKTGNERPLEIVSEAWYSDELQTLVMSKSFDPRVGETTYKLTDIQRGEPSRALFEVPVDYSIRDEPASLDSRSVEKSKNK
jgi:hypothetical protein